MKPSIDLLAVLANVVILVLFVSAVARSTTSQVARLVIAAFALVCAWLITAALDSMRAPVWTMFIGGVMIVVSTVVIVATLHLWTRPGEPGVRHPENRDDGGGGEPRRPRPDTPRPGGGGSDPTWWPEFERSLALYAAERARENRHPAVVPTERLPRCQTAAATHAAARLRLAAPGRRR